MGTTVSKLDLEDDVQIEPIEDVEAIYCDENAVKAIAEVVKDIAADATMSENMRQIALSATVQIFSEMRRGADKCNETLQYED